MIFYTYHIISYVRLWILSPPGRRHGIWDCQETVTIQGVLLFSFIYLLFYHNYLKLNLLKQLIVVSCGQDKLPWYPLL